MLSAHVAYTMRRRLGCAMPRTRPHRRWFVYVDAQQDTQPHNNVVKSGALLDVRGSCGVIGKASESPRRVGYLVAEQ